MPLLDKLEKKFRWFGIPNITLHLVIGQSLVFILLMSQRIDYYFIALTPAFVLRGEVWRLFTFLLIPPQTSPIFIIFALYIFYIMGTALEHFWGAFRYTIFLLIAYLATIGVSFLTPYSPSSNMFIGGSVFLAFATLNPDFELALFFILPVKTKWLALLTWLSYGYQMIVGTTTTRLLIVASVLNYLIFFGRDILLRLRSQKWRMERKAQEFSRQNQPVHRCTLCGITDKDDPDVIFRYCTKCEGTLCYCEQHIRNHEHIGNASSEAGTE